MELQVLGNVPMIVAIAKIYDADGSL